MNRLMGRLVAALVLMLATAALAQVQERVLDDFEDPAAWTIAASDDVKASLRVVDGEQGKAA